MKECDITSGRTTQSGFVNDKYAKKLQVDAFVLRDETPIQVKKLINKAVEENKTLILVFHKFSEGGEYSYEKDDFIEILDYMCSIRDKLNIITYSQWIDYIDSIQ